MIHGKVKTFSMTLSKNDTLVIAVYYGNESTQAIMYLDNILYHMT